MQNGLFVLNASIVLGISNHQNTAANFQVYPNPTTSNSMLHFNVKRLSNEISFSLFSLDGKELISNKIVINSDPNFKLPNLSDGIYMLKVKTENSLEVKKLVIRN